jgi:hypothetical protein
MSTCRSSSIAVAVLVVLLSAAEARGQNLGTFTWQLSPFCNVVTLTAIQDGPTVILSGSDDQCGTVPAPTIGSVALNPDGTAALGLSTIRPDGVMQTTRANISTADGNGPWVDQDGNSGTFVFSPAAVSGSPRPVRPPIVALHHTAFSNVFQSSTATGGVAEFSDGIAIQTTGLNQSEFRDARSHGTNNVAITGLNRPGAYLSARLHAIFVPITDAATYVIAGGTNSAGVPLADGFGFKNTATGLKGVTIASGIETVVDLATILGASISDPSADVVAARRLSSVDFYVNGVLKGTSTTNLPVQAFSIYEIRVQNASDQMGPQGISVSFMTIGIPPQ